MKKSSLICITTIVFLLITTIYFAANNKNTYYQKQFAKWDKGEFTEIEGAEFFQKFQDYLSLNPEISNEKIWGISERLNILEFGGLRVIEYIENPDKYGRSGRLSYHILQFNETTVSMNYGGSFHIYDIAKTDKNIFYLYGYDYKFSNQTGLSIIKVVPQEKNLDIKRNVILLEKNFTQFQLVNDSLYYNDSHINIKEIDKRSLALSIEMNNTIFYLKLNNDEFYYLPNNF